MVSFEHQLKTSKSILNQNLNSLLKAKIIEIHDLWTDERELD